ncbi:MAG TPA: hypothetical protein VM534_08375 [Thermoanaerobaculia bacterium]|nr:hypothetical protein [Thermoanaerobaculia bacterium]
MNPGVAVAGLVALLTAGAVAACEDTDPYARALCLYQSDQTEGAAEILMEMIRADEQVPQTLRAHYFLARIRMEQERWAEAEGLLIGIFSKSRPFYREWNCDFLLGVCRRSLGKDG